MKKNKFKRVLSVALTAVMVAGAITFIPGGITEVHAETTPKNINLGTGGIGNPNSTASDAWTGSKVYYAGKECYVLDKNGALTGGKSSVTNHMLLLTKDVLSMQQKFDDDKSDWSTSIIRQNLNDIGKTEASGGFLGTMTSLEQTAIDATKINSSNTTKLGYDSFPSTETKDKIFLLDLADVKNANYGFTSDATRAAGSPWWLRSPTNHSYDAAYVVNDGFAHMYGNFVYVTDCFVRPAFNLNLSAVLFTSASGTSKSSFSQVNNTAANTWKLTLKDSSKKVSVTSGQSVTKSGQVVTVPYTYTGSDVSQISIMITDKDRTASDASILYYGALVTTLATTGTGTFTLPEGLPEGYKVYMMSEDVKDGNLTDYSSVPVELPKPVSTYKIIEGAGGTWTSGTDGTLSIRGDGEVSKFKEVKVDGTVVDGSNYTVTEDSTIVTFKADYLKTLSVGTHTFELVWTDGSATNSFTVKEATTTTPSNKDDVTKTGDSTPLVSLFILALISGIGILYFARKRRIIQ